VSNGTAQLVFCNVPTRDAGSLLQFYATLLGIDPGAFVHNTNSPIDQYQTPITGNSGIDLLITQRNDNREVTTTYWSVPDLAAAIQELTSQGGVQVEEGQASDGSKSAVLLDPEGNYIGLVQLAQHAEEYFRLGRVEGDDQLARRRKQLRSAVGSRY
jgi:predicted enzyme related to lactoylglutathione lyase